MAPSLKMWAKLPWLTTCAKQICVILSMRPYKSANFPCFIFNLRKLPMFHSQFAKTFHVLLPVCANWYVLHLGKLISFIINFPYIFSKNGLLSLSFVQTVIFLQILSFCVNTARNIAQNPNLFAQTHVCVSATFRNSGGSEGQKDYAAKPTL